MFSLHFDVIHLLVIFVFILVGGVEGRRDDAREYRKEEGWLVLTEKTKGFTEFEKESAYRLDDFSTGKILCRC